MARETMADVHGRRDVTTKSCQVSRGRCADRSV